MKDATEAHSPLGPHETLEKRGKFMDERTGIFAWLREYELPWESPIHVCVGELKPEFCIAKPSGRKAISGTVCGAGATALAAKVSCLGEALERHSGICRGDEKRRLARYSELGEGAIRPDSLTLFSQAQYDDRDEWNEREGRYNWVPARFDPERSIDWSPAWSLTQKTTKYLPTAYCYFGYPFDSAHDFCRPDSNGNAAGSNLDGAIVHGFLELVERECASVWWYNRVRRPGVDIDSFGLPDACVIRGIYSLIGRSLDVLDITADRQIPAFVAVSRTEEPPGEDYVLGFGAHFDAQIALARALKEITQFLPVVMAGRDPSCFLRAEDVPMDMAYLVADQQMAPTLYSDFSPLTAREERQDVLACVGLTETWGLEMLVLDQSREDVGMPVVKVVVPGMRNWWARFAAGRLYTLPVQLGWLGEPTKESDLNPNHLIL
ncbi:MAG: YcaO-like family protein [Candidatus Korobacteraceae bacterium]